ncbi:MAG: serine hydrolase domain-containing protein, partial [Bacteroidota bacterium]
LAQESSITQKADALLTAAVAEGHTVGIAAGISKNGITKWTGQAGKSHLNKSASFTSSTVNRIASITKPMTAVAIMQLREQGKLKLEDKIGQYLPAFTKGDKNSITIRHVLHHTSGLRAYANNKERNNKIHYPTLADALKIFVDDELLFPPGTDFAYTSYGYVVLGLVIEKASGLSYGEYLQQHIWVPAGMTQTSIEIAGQPYPNKAGIYHLSKPGKIKEPPPTDISDRLPGGGVQSTVTDLLKFSNALLDGTLVNREQLRLMSVDCGLKQQGSGYGFGWYLYGDNPTMGELIGHTGAQLGASAFLMIAPEQNTSVVVLTNTSGALQRVSDITVQLINSADQFD